MTQDFDEVSVPKLLPQPDAHGWGSFAPSDFLGLCPLLSVNGPRLAAFIIRSGHPRLSSKEK